MEGISITPETAAAHLILPAEQPPPQQPAPQPPMPRLYPISVEKYHAMIEAGILTENDRCELIEGLLVEKMSKNRLHSYVTGWITQWFHARATSDWFADSQEPFTTLESEPEPDVTVIRGRRADYPENHPLPHNVLLLVEVAESTLTYDRTVKKRLYARAGIPIYWIVNLIDKQVEIFTQPSGPAEKPDFAGQRVVSASEDVEVVIDGKSVGRIEVKELFPS